MSVYVRPRIILKALTWPKIENYCPPLRYIFTSLLIFNTKCKNFITDEQFSSQFLVATIFVKLDIEKVCQQKKF